MHPDFISNNKHQTLIHSMEHLKFKNPQNCISVQLSFKKKRKRTMNDEKDESEI